MIQFWKWAFIVIWRMQRGRWFVMRDVPMSVLCEFADLEHSKYPVASRMSEYACDEIIARTNQLMRKNNR